MEATCMNIEETGERAEKLFNSRMVCAEMTGITA
jgi:hypothetical protein